MRSFLWVVGGIAFVVGAVMTLAADTVLQQIVSMLGVVAGVTALGTGGVIAAIDSLRETNIKIHSIERTERLQRDLASGNPELVARAREAAGTSP